MAKVFISYRRADSQHPVDRLYAGLRKYLPKKEIFMDVDNIPPGVDFVDHLSQQVAKCETILVVIGPQWLSIENDQGVRRLDDPEDFVRVEIEAALERNVPVVPVLLDGTPMPRADQLPVSLKPFARRNALELRRNAFQPDLQTLAEKLHLKKASKLPALAAVLAVVLAAGAGAWAWTNGMISIPEFETTQKEPQENPTDIPVPTATSTQSAETTSQDPQPIAATQASQLAGRDDIAWEGAVLVGTKDAYFQYYKNPEFTRHTVEAKSALDSYEQAVMRLQTALNAKGFNAGIADGVAGAGTRRAVEAYRAKVNYSVSSVDLTQIDAAPINTIAASIESWIDEEKIAREKAEAKKRADERAAKQAAEALAAKQAAEAKQRAAELAAKQAAEAERRRIAEAKAREAAKYAVGNSFTDCSGCPEMVVVPSGSFRMGSPSSEADRYHDEGPQRTVRIGYKFAVGKYEVTKGQFHKFVLETGYKPYDVCWSNEYGKWEKIQPTTYRNPGMSQSENHPVICVSWNDAKAYAKWLSGKTGHIYRLLSEAEWEYAARAGTTSAYSFGSTISTSQANHNGDVGKTTPIGQYRANAFGLYDMHGNVLEWVEDCYDTRGFRDAPSNGSAFTNCSSQYRRVLRGGSWYSSPKYLRSASRKYSSKLSASLEYGFRLARHISE